MKQIVVTTPGNLDPKSKEKLTKEGYLVIEAKSPGSVYFDINKNESNIDLLMSAMSGLNIGDGFGRKGFFDEIYKRLKDNEIKNK